ncbi:MAG: hypothetical protein Kow0073_01660 [Immundisolibacter sp.]
MSIFHPLALTGADSPVHLVSADMLTVPQVTLDDAASTVITDLRGAATLTVPADTRIDAALERMIHAGVRLLFVVDGGFTLLGLITAHDIEGERPMQFLHSHGAAVGDLRRGDIRVGDLMEPVEQWRVLLTSSLVGARVGDLVATFAGSGRRHLVVVEPERDGSHRLCGLCSARRLERALGQPIDTGPSARNFAQLVQAIEHPQ